MQYAQTTTSENYRDWPWFRSYVQGVERRKKDGSANPAVDEQLPVDIGVAFCERVLEIPEICDMVYRNFVLTEENRPEGVQVRERNLLSFATVHFLTMNGHAENSGYRLVACWRPLAFVLQGKSHRPRSSEFRETLLTADWAFTPVN